jgi:hypothetical protein
MSTVAGMLYVNSPAGKDHPSAGKYKYSRLISVFSLNAYLLVTNTELTVTTGKRDLLGPDFTTENLKEALDVRTVVNPSAVPFGTPQLLRCVNRSLFLSQWMFREIRNYVFCSWRDELELDMGFM